MNALLPHPPTRAERYRDHDARVMHALAGLPARAYRTDVAQRAGLSNYDVSCALKRLETAGRVQSAVVRWCEHGGRGVRRVYWVTE